MMAEAQRWTPGHLQRLDTFMEVCTKIQGKLSLCSTVQTSKSSGIYHGYWHHPHRDHIPL